ncbi:MAG: 2-oxoacid:ferredoxin oxidoreductase subunit beta [Clostridia bacterium]|nr:2-oxoacid:ferredoxin oxidoreductase subunit beta [Clostridia bacterium]
MAVTLVDYEAERPTWCPGCGDFAVLQAIKKALTELEIPPHEAVVVTGIGCSGKTNSYLGAYGLHGLHGRALPLAQAIKLANRHLTVLAVGGDGDGYGIGVGHLVHAIRRNVDITYIVDDNGTYGLTKGQTSPTAGRGYQSKSSPYGAAEDPVRPLGLALGLGAGFVAQGFSGAPNALKDLIVRAIQHRGFSLVNVLSPCVTFNEVNTYAFYREHLVDVADIAGYNARDRAAALRVAIERDYLITGVVYEDPDGQDYAARLPGYAEEPLARAGIRRDARLWEELTARYRTG